MRVRRYGYIPVGHEQRQTDSLHDTGKRADGDSVERALLGEDLSDNLQSNQRTTRASRDERVEHTPGAALAMKIKLPRYAAPL